MGNDTAITRYIDQNRDQLKVRAPENVPVERIEKWARKICMEDSKVRKAQPNTIVNSVMFLASWDLEPNHFDHAWIIPYEYTRSNGTTVTLAKPHIGYKGYIHLVTKYEDCRKVTAKVVYENDGIRLWQENEQGNIEHEIYVGPDRGQVIGAYAHFFFGDGLRTLEYMDIGQLETVREAARKQRNGNDSPAWRDFPEQMYKKVVIRRAMNHMDLSPDLQKVVGIDDSNHYEFDDAMDRGNDQSIEDAEYEEVEEPSKITDRATKRAGDSRNDERDSAEELIVGKLQRAMKGKVPDMIQDDWISAFKWKMTESIGVSDWSKIRAKPMRQILDRVGEMGDEERFERLEKLHDEYFQRWNRKCRGYVSRTSLGDPEIIMGNWHDAMKAEHAADSFNDITVSQLKEEFEAMKSAEEDEECPAGADKVIDELIVRYEDS